MSSVGRDVDVVVGRWTLRPYHRYFTPDCFPGASQVLLSYRAWVLVSSFSSLSCLRCCQRLLFLPFFLARLGFCCLPSKSLYWYRHISVFILFSFLPAWHHSTYFLLPGGVWSLGWCDSIFSWLYPHISVLIKFGFFFFFFFLLSLPCSHPKPEFSIFSFQSFPVVKSMGSETKVYWSKFQTCSLLAVWP